MDLIENPITTSCSSDSTEHFSIRTSLPSYGTHNYRNVTTHKEINNNSDSNLSHNTIPNKASKELIDGTTKNKNRNVFIDIPCRVYNGNYVRKTNQKLPVKNKTYVDDTESNIPRAQHATCSKRIPEAKTQTFDEKCFDPGQYLHISNDVDKKSTGNDKIYAEKTTYCRPVLNLYNQEFIYKTIERNVKLQGLVKKLVRTREMEKQNEVWNNYINELKNKYGHCSNLSSLIKNEHVKYEDNTELIDDYYKTKFTFKQSNPCQNLLQDLYGTYNRPETHYNSYEGNNGPSPTYGYYYDNDRYCYPTASEGSFMLLERSRQNQHSYRNFNGKTIVVDRLCKDCRKAAPPSRQQFERTKLNRNLVLRKKFKSNISTQTFLPVVNEEGNPKEVKQKERYQNTHFNRAVIIGNDLIKATITENERRESINENEKVEAISDKYKLILNNIEILKEKAMGSQSEPKTDPLENIEDKLNNLIETMKSFMVEIRSKALKHDSKSASILCKFSNSNNERINLTQSDTSYGIYKRDELICGMAHDNSSPLGYSELNPNRFRHLNDEVSRIDKILYEEMDKSGKARRDIDNILNGEASRPCGVQITFDIPTKECSTEVTDSLSRTKIKDKKVFVEEIKTSWHPRGGRAMTIAVNTDPLSWLALFRVSTETIKQMLSYMPHIDYNSYLSMLHFPQTLRKGLSRYVCNICGASFARPSQLSDHIHEHNLGNTRDCCVCRHVLDLHQTRAGLFSCQYCGHRFTRAYCCELHQQGCAKRLGRNHDVASDLMLLR